MPARDRTAKEAQRPVMRPTIYVVDDDQSFLTAISRVLEDAGYSFALYSTAEDALRLLPAIGRGCILLDIEMGGMSGPQLHRQLAASGCQLPIVYVTGYGDIEKSVQAIKAGAEDFLPKPISKLALLAAVERALSRYDAEVGHLSHLNDLQSLVKGLTPREFEVYRLVVSGLKSKQIAHQLGISERTIKAHRQRLMQKLNVDSIVELVQFADELRVANRQTI
jgi:FixJ family two-component response regulator